MACVAPPKGDRTMKYALPILASPSSGLRVNVLLPPFVFQVSTS